MVGLGRTLSLLATVGTLSVATGQAAPVSAADRPAGIRVGNLANKGELARFERRVWDGCGHEARIRLQRVPSAKRAGRVIDQHPPRGTRVGCRDASAILYVSAGPQQAQIYVPALVEPGRRRAFLRQLREACNALVRLTEVRRPYPLPPGRFVDQSPAQGERYRCGMPVEVVLSAGPRGLALATRDAAPPARVGERGPGRSASPAPAASPPPARAIEPPAAHPGAVAAEPQSAPAHGETAASAPTRTAPPTSAPAPAARPVLPAAIAAPPERAPRPAILVPSLLLLLLAALLVLAMLRRLAPPARSRPHAIPDRTTAPVAPTAPLAPLLTLERGWPTADARLLPAPARLHPGPPADALPAVPLLRDFLRPLDPALDWIAATPLDALAGPPARHGPTSETLSPLRSDLADALRFALLFELPPLLADAWAAASELPFLPGGPRRGWVGLAPHVVAVRVRLQLQLRAAGVPVARPTPELGFRFTFPAARLFLRGTALDAFEPGAVQVSARLDWAGDSRPLAVLRPHAEWPGSLPVLPPRQVQAGPAALRRAAG